MKRHPEWETRLADTVAGWAQRAYALGQADCGLFAAACVEAVTGEGMWPKIGFYKTEAGLARALARAGLDGLDAGATACLGDPLPPLMAHRGDVVSDGRALGVMTGAGPMVFSEDGMVIVARESLVACWAVGRADG
jgi:hypothetical protein